MSDREGDDDDDREHDFPKERQKYIAERQTPGRAHEWNGRRYVDPPGYDATKDQEELRKTKRQVDAVISQKRNAERRRGRESRS